MYATKAVRRILRSGIRVSVTIAFAFGAYDIGTMAMLWNTTGVKFDANISNIKVADFHSGAQMNGTYAGSEDSASIFTITFSSLPFPFIVVLESRCRVYLDFNRLSRPCRVQGYYAVK